MFRIHCDFCRPYTGPHKEALLPAFPTTLTRNASQRYRYWPVWSQLLKILTAPPAITPQPHRQATSIIDRLHRIYYSTLPSTNPRYMLGTGRRQSHCTIMSLNWSTCAVRHCHCTTFLATISEHHLLMHYCLLIACPTPMQTMGEYVSASHRLLAMPMYSTAILLPFRIYYTLSCATWTAIVYYQ